MGPPPVTDRPHQLTRLTLGDAADAWRRAGFAVDANGSFRLGRTDVVALGTGRPGVLGWALDGIDHPLDGLATVDGHDDDAPDRSPSSHPNGITRLDHVVVSTGDCERTTAAFSAAGLELRGTRSTTAFGSPVRQSFFWAGDVILELVGPDDGEPTTDEPTSILGLAMVADDLDATAEWLGDRVGTPKDAVQPGRRIATLRHRDLGLGLPVAVMTPHRR